MPGSSSCWIPIAVLLCLLPGCGGPGRTGTPEQPFAGQTLRVFNWSDYIAEDLIPEFEKRTGAEVVYDKYSSEGELETKLAVAGGAGYDVVFPSDRSMAPLIRKGLLHEVDRSQLPNWKHLDPKFLNPPYDPGNKYGVPYFWGTVAVGVRTDKVPEAIKGFEALFNEKYRGRITMLDDPENVVAVGLLHLGLPMNSTSDEDLARVKELLLKQRPLVEAYTSDEFKEKLLKGEAWVVLGWSGDILQARSEDKDRRIQAIVPETGTMIYVDSMAIPKGARNVPLAHAFINFLLDPGIAARNAEYVRYATPNLTAKEKLSKEMLDDPAIYPPPAVLDRCQWLKDRGAGIAKIEKLWRQIKN